MITRTIKLITLFFLCLLPSSTINATSLFWSDWIETAVLLRDSFEKSSTISAIDVPLTTLDDSKKSQLLNIIEKQNTGTNPWYFFYRGLIDNSQMEPNFHASLNNASHDPGTTWLLFLSFFKNGHDNWAATALEQLEKLLIESGADQSVLISRQLYHTGLQFEDKGDAERATQFFKWALSFDTSNLSLTNRLLWMNFPLNIPFMFSSLAQQIPRISNSWRMQLDIISSVHFFLKTWFVVVSIVIALLLLIKHLPVALHRIDDLFPTTVPLQLKTILSAAAFCAFSSFGLLPFLWGAAFTIFKYLSQKEKVLFSVTLAFLTLAPVDIHLQTIFSRGKNPELSPVLFYRSVHEGFSNEIFSAIQNQIKENPDDHLLLLAATNYALKNGNVNASTYYAGSAMSLLPADPVVLVTSGNVAFLKNDISRAEKLYKSATELDKNSPEAFFNLGQCYLRKFETAEGMRLINQAVSINPDYVNNFIKKNDQHFPDSMPELRQIMFADYSSLSFWKNIKNQNIYNTESAKDRWGTSFLGFSPWPSFFLALVLWVVLLLLQLNQNEKKIRTLFECRFCGRNMCKKCRNGSLCHECADATKFVHNEQTLEKIKQNVINKTRFKKDLISITMNTLLPGSGPLLDNSETAFSKNLILIIISSLVYIAYSTILNSYLDFVTIRKEHCFLLVFSLLFSLFFVTKSGIALFREITKFIRTMEG